MTADYNFDDNHRAALRYLSAIFAEENDDLADMVVDSVPTEDLTEGLLLTSGLLLGMVADLKGMSKQEVIDDLLALSHEKY